MSAQRPRGHGRHGHASNSATRHPGHGPAGARQAGSGRAAHDVLVAVLERRGRFLVAEPLFPRHEAADGRGHRHGAARVTLGPARSGAARQVRAGAGDLVLVQTRPHGGGARVVRVLGRPNVARDVIEGLLLDRGLARGFDAALESDAKAAGERVARAPGRRRDLRDLPTFTIDPVSARDFDDAISAEAIDGGGVRVWVHIADVAAHVPAGSTLDREARRRATSVYAPGAVEPMLPHALSSEACSLMPGVERAAVTVELELQGATVARAAFHRSLIRSDARLDYEQVDRIFAGTEAAAEPWATSLQAARVLAAALGRERERRGALVIESEEPEFQFDEQGNVTAILPRAQTESHRLIEHLMIAANEAVARLLEQRGVPCLYRVHERPEPERVQRLADQLASLDVPTPALPGEHMSSTQAATLLGEMSLRVDEHVRRTGHGRQALSSLVLRSLKQAYYSPRNLGHAGLRSACYCHFTSPIRRYPDIVCHRALLSAIGGEEPAPRAGELAELGAWTSERERDAMLIERDSDDVARCFMLERLLYEHGADQVFAGEVIGLISAGAFVAFGAGAAGEENGAGEAQAQGAPTFEGMLPVRRLRAPAPAAAAAASDARTERERGRGRQQGDRRARGGARRVDGGGDSAREWWELNEQGTILHGEHTGAVLRLGDAIDVRVSSVDAVRGRVDLEPAP
ncbi:MAG TPA: RNB domain-containing ribonuclease [Solirubrobacteraceae bacterium]|nr:RNB domain-containing ribonuclease [Solirubrobacteraceae bacterium]